MNSRKVCGLFFSAAAALGVPRVSRAACSDLSIFIRLGDRPGCYQGHSGIGVDGEYYDWGPKSESDLRVYTIGSPGSPYEDLRQVPAAHKDRPGLSTVSDIRDFFRHGANECETWELRGKILPEAAGEIANKWENIYATKPYFYYLLNQCTTLACRSLIAGHITGARVVLWPKHLLEVASRFRSSCGQANGQLFKRVQLHR